MENVSFTYNGKAYQSSVRVSSNKEPHYYWCYLKGTELAKEIGDCVLFIGNNGEIRTPHYYHIEHRTLIDSLENALKHQVVTNGQNQNL